MTLGTRLLSSHSPTGYEAIGYGRGTWLFHMLRTMMKDAAQKEGKVQAGGTADEPFVRALRNVRQRYEGKAISTRELLDVFAEELPPSLRYEGKKSLDWFLDGWIDGTSLPTLEVKGVKFSAKGCTTGSGDFCSRVRTRSRKTACPARTGVRRWGRNIVSAFSPCTNPQNIAGPV